MVGRMSAGIVSITPLYRNTIFHMLYVSHVGLAPVFSESKEDRWELYNKFQFQGGMHRAGALQQPKERDVPVPTPDHRGARGSVVRGWLFAEGDYLLRR